MCSDASFPYGNFSISLWQMMCNFFHMCICCPYTSMQWLFMSQQTTHGSSSNYSQHCILWWGDLMRPTIGLIICLRLSNILVVCNHFDSGYIFGFFPRGFSLGCSMFSGWSLRRLNLGRPRGKGRAGSASYLYATSSHLQGWNPKPSKTNWHFTV